MKTVMDNNTNHFELRFGYVVNIFYKIKNKPMPKQLDLLNEWFPSLIVQERNNEGVKEAPTYNDLERIIYATKYQHTFYGTGDVRVTHIIGKLVGTTSSNQEKERKSAELIQKKISKIMLNGNQVMIKTFQHIGEKINDFDQKQQKIFHKKLEEFIIQTASRYYEKEEYIRENELFSFDDEVFDQIIYNSFYQLQLQEPNSLINAYLWLLLGSLLRNECGRITRAYDSSFVPLYKTSGESETLLDKLNYLMNPKEYTPYYVGDDMDKRYPGIEWYCDECIDHLNEQEGFDDHLPVWQCRKCGYLNIIGDEEIYMNKEGYDHQIQKFDIDLLQKAIKDRKKEIEK